MDFQRKKNDYSNIRINGEIRYPDARVIYKENANETSENDFNKVMKVADAIRFAESIGLDLIEINPCAKPPVLKIYDYQKYVWEQKQIEKKKKKGGPDMKEIQLTVNISKHDMETKARHALEFIEKGHKVKVVLSIKGRELSRRDESSTSIYRFLGMMGDEISYDCAPKDEGNKVIAILKKKK